MPTRSIKFLIVYASLLALCSCGHGAGNSAEIYYDRDNVEDARLVDISDMLPEMHAATQIYIIGDTLILHDTKSTDRQFHAFDIRTNRLLGSFGKFGNGPGEIANFGGIFFDAGKRILYGSNLNQWQISGFQLDSALADTTYNAFVKTKLIGTDGPTSILRDPYFINDSLVICARLVPTEDWSKLRNSLGYMDLRSGKSYAFNDILGEKESRNTIAVYPKEDFIVAAAKTHDWMRFFDMEGNLKKSFYGPDFVEKRPKNMAFFHTVILTDSLIITGYTGQTVLPPRKYEDIIVFNHEGEYIKSLRVYGAIWGLAYHKGTNRLYVALDGEPQFSYIQLTD